jgi:hypothetical protein
MSKSEQNIRALETFKDLELRWTTSVEFVSIPSLCFVRGSFLATTLGTVEFIGFVVKLFSA